MKILFIFSVIPHYYKWVLNQLSKVRGLNLSVVVPIGSSKNVGEGVYPDEQGVNFKVIHLKEYTAYYGKSFFKDLIVTISDENPDIIVIVWPYILGFLFFPKLLKYIRKN
ncbi:MAG: glycosyltransferase family 1 protein, partial [Ignavibacterium sp.]